MNLIRNAEINDIPSLIELESKLMDPLSPNGFVTYQLSEELWRTFLSTSRVSVKQNKVVGVLAFAPPHHKALEELSTHWERLVWEKKPFPIHSFTWIERISVDKDHTRQGIGKALISTLAARPLLVASVAKPYRNIAAERLYEKEGFKKYGYYLADQYKGFRDYQSIIWGLES